MWKRVTVVSAVMLFAASASWALAQEAAAPSGEACATQEYRQFDFWIGSWEVTIPDGNVAGVNTIDSILSGCVLRERWESTRGMNGTSFNTYDPHAGAWHQTWVDDRGGFLLLSGGIREGSMVLSGVMRDEEGPILHRISWTPISAGEVRQLWETSRDGGTTWDVAFDGRYRRQEATADQNAAD